MTGIIPARAGFTRRCAGISPPARDHPRSRGVYLCCTAAGAFNLGSSPLARGLREEYEEGGFVGRIIPARAGFTSPWTRVRRPSGDHPRSRGVYIHRSPLLGRLRGSSPLARGLPTAHPESGASARIIPARAGFTPTRRSRCHRYSDHPRSRGVYLADPWNPNEPVLYQTPAAFTADLGPAPPSCGSAVVVPRWTTTPSGA